MDLRFPHDGLEGVRRRQQADDVATLEDERQFLVFGLELVDRFTDVRLRRERHLWCGEVLQRDRSASEVVDPIDDGRDVHDATEVSEFVADEREAGVWTRTDPIEIGFDRVVRRERDDLVTRRHDLTDGSFAHDEGIENLFAAFLGEVATVEQRPQLVSEVGPRFDDVSFGLEPRAGHFTSK